MNDKETKYKSFQEDQRISINLEGGGELLILLKVNIARTYRIEYFLNGKLIKPKPFGGKTKAFKAWAELIGSLIENRDGYQPLTPEGQSNGEANEN